MTEQLTSHYNILPGLANITGNRGGNCRFGEILDIN